MGYYKIALRIMPKVLESVLGNRLIFLYYYPWNICGLIKERYPTWSE